MSKNTFFRVHNDSSQSERRAILRNEREVGTYHAFATGEAGAVGGRFAAREKSTVIGAGQVAYPALPANSPWYNDPVPPEEPLGVDLSAAPVVGEAHEVAASLADEGIIPLASPPNGPPNDEGRAPLGGILPAAASRRPRRVSRKG
jgi:hypothetical protein